ncbi:MAG: CADD family putative folate metabolism protein [Thermoplasmata archaeon]|nr:CADD family putative folate metabolism protein [Thermoplasmata archaeon]
MTTIRGIDRRIARRHLLKHPFYQAWSMGKVELPTLQAYAGQYFQFEQNFPRFVAAAYSRVTNVAGRRSLLDNLVDEEGRDPTHPELWLRFADALGVPRSEVIGAKANPATRRLLATYERYAVRGTAGSGLGALYAYESIFPAVAAEKARGLAKFYGIAAERALEFFRVHESADVEHSGAERALLQAELSKGGASARAVEEAVQATMDAWWGFLDAFDRPRAG